MTTRREVEPPAATGEPTPRSFLLLVNPASGGGRAEARTGPVVERLRQAGAEVEVVASRGQRHSRERVAAAAESGQVVIACGGDGMLASVAGAAVTHGVTLGIIPCGRGNDFARQLGLLDRSLDELVRILLTARPAAVDVLRVGEQVALGSVYAGVDSVTSELVDRVQRLPGVLQYPYAAVRSLLTHQPSRYTVEVDGAMTSVAAYSIVVANSGYYGKGMHIAPAASVDDGLLEVVVIPAPSRLRLIWLMPQVYSGRHVRHPLVLTLRGRAIRISADGPVVAYGDGERLRELPVAVEVDPGALAVLR